MKIGDSIKKRIEELKSMPDEDLRKWADGVLEDAINKQFVPCKPPELFTQVDELSEDTEVFKILPVLHRFKKDLL